MGPADDASKGAGTPVPTATGTPVPTATGTPVPTEESLWDKHKYIFIGAGIGLLVIIIGVIIFFAMKSRISLEEGDDSNGGDLDGGSEDTNGTSFGF